MFFLFLCVSQTSRYSANQTFMTSTILSRGAPVCLPSMLDVTKQPEQEQQNMTRYSLQPADNKDSKIKLLN